MLDLPDLFSIEIRSAHNQKLVCVLIFYMELIFWRKTFPKKTCHIEELIKGNSIHYLLEVERAFYR